MKFFPRLATALSTSMRVPAATAAWNTSTSSAHMREYCYEGICLKAWCLGSDGMPQAYGDMWKDGVHPRDEIPPRSYQSLWCFFLLVQSSCLLAPRRFPGDTRISMQGRTERLFLFCHDCDGQGRDRRNAAYPSACFPDRRKGTSSEALPR